MSARASLVRSGAYFDSIVLLRLQSGLKDLAGVEDSGAVMATPTNLEILAANDLLVDEAADAGPDDLLIVVRAETAAAADAALERVDELLRQRRGGGDEDYRPHSLRAAITTLPEADWVLISVPGRWAARVAREALDRRRNVFLYSDNVSLEDEADLKRLAGERGLLVMGPDCGTAIVGGVGFGFANRVARGPVGLVAASGTGLQAVTCGLHERGVGISHALGTGGRDLSGAIGAATTLQALDLLSRDPETEVIVLLSKPPDPEVAAAVLAAARRAGKPVVVDFLGQVSLDQGAPTTNQEPLHFAASLDDAAAVAARLAGRPGDSDRASTAETGEEQLPPTDDTGGGSYLRGLFSGGTLAFEALLGLRTFLAPIASNVTLAGVEPATDLMHSQGHTLLDLGADDFTVGRLHPMMDPDLRLRRLRQEAADREVGAVLLDVVLGDGSHADPAGELATTIAEIRGERPLAVAVILLGTDLDPQGMEDQRQRLEEAGARVFAHVGPAVEWLRRTLPTEDRPPRVGAVPAAGGAGDPGRDGAGSLAGDSATAPTGGDATATTEVPLTALTAPPAVLNVGLEVFYDSLEAQGARAVQVEWRPPAGGNEKLLALLERMK